MNSPKPSTSAKGAAPHASDEDGPEIASPNLFLDVAKLNADHAVTKLIEHAVSLGASDLFLVANEQNLTAQVRHLGFVRPIAIVPTEQGKRILSHIRAAASIPLEEKRKPLDGRWIFRRSEGEPVDLRISSIPTLHGEDMAIRLLVRGNKLFGLDQLGMTREQLQAYEQMITSPGGLILITGPTGSGKTGTLYASLTKLNDGRRKINTIEDPTEYAIDGLRQSQVNTAIGLGFAELLRSVLRQSPDAIMIGEIRDAETAQTAVHAANSGILVLATLHAPSAPGAIQSMRGLGAHPHFLSTCLLGVVSQRLVRTLDPATRTSFDLGEAPGTFDEVRKWLAPGEGKTLYAPGLAESNHMTGYSGRTGVFEVMRVTRELRNLIAEGRPTSELRDKAVDQGMLPFRAAALLKVARGETSTEEVFRVIPTEHLTDGGD